MAKFEEGDERWIVREREDGRNCNNWHWTTKDVSGHTKESLTAALHACIFDAPLEGCSITSADVKGEASVLNRKGRIFLIYEFEVKLKWEGTAREGSAAAAIAGAPVKGSMRLPDVSAECLDDLEVEYSCSSSGSALSESMRKAGLAHVRRIVATTIGKLQEELRTQQQQQQPQRTQSVASKPPMPQPIKSVPAISSAPRPVATAPAAPPACDDADGAPHDSERLPPQLDAAVARLRKSPSTTKELTLSNASIADCHLQPLIEALHHSQCALDILDLGFNQITDAGVHVLCQALASGCALELTRLHLGGNRVSVAGMALSQNLKRAREDLRVEWKPQLRNGRSMCSVGTVYANSPAARAGLTMGDSILAFGVLKAEGYKSVTESIVPIVKSSLGKPVDLVVARIEEGGQVRQLAISLTPQQWSGGGLLGCILK